MPKVLLFIAGIIQGLSFSAHWLPSHALGMTQVASLTVLFFFVFKRQGLKRTVQHTLIFSIGYFCTGLYWVFISLHTYGHVFALLSALAVLLLALYLSIYPLIAVALFTWLNRKNTLFSVVLLATTWAFGEWLRATLFTGFPWLTIAYAHADSPLGAWAPIWGAYGVSFLAAFIAAQVAFFLAGLHVKAHTFMSAFVFGLIIAGGGLLQTVQWSTPTGKAIAVRLLQGNIDQLDKFDPDTLFDQVDHYLALANSPSADPTYPPEVVIFPETIITRFQHVLPPFFWQNIIDSAKRQYATYLIGIPYFVRPEPLSYTNSIIKIDAHTNVSSFYTEPGVRRYNKQHLVPFGEYVPFGFRWLVEALAIPLGDFDKGGNHQANFTIHHHTFAPNICYEDIFGEELLPALFPTTTHNGEGQTKHKGATILFNVSNLAWFGNSSALGQHLEMARMRSLETARPMLRATNTGATAYIDEKGHVVARLPYATTGVLDVTVQGTTGYTPYSRTGDNTFLIVMAALLVIALIRQHLLKKPVMHS